MTHAESFVSLSDMVEEYLDSLWRNLRFADADGDLAEAKREFEGKERSEEVDPPETWE